MSVTSLGMALDKCQSIRLWASRSEDWACLEISGDEMSGEIRMERIHVEALRDQVSDVLVDMDRTAAEDVACGRAGLAEQRAVDAATKALDMVVEAEAAGAPDLAAQLREYAAEVTASASAVDVAVRAFERAAVDADSATESLIYVTRKANAALRRLRDDDRPAALTTP